MDRHPDHAKLLGEIIAMAPPALREGHGRDSYGGSGHLYYDLPVPERRAIARRWVAGRRGSPVGDRLALIDSLFAGDSHEEKTLASIILGYDASARRAARPSDVDRWLGRLHGWAEIDSLCQSVFTPDDLAADWPAWRDLIRRLAGDPNINKRRAAMVLLNAPVRTSSDVRFRDLALEVIDRLKGERDILITKAVSWLLRSMVGRHRQAVVDALERGAAVLPAVALRETRAKLETGVKSGRPRRA
jgi:3-methyladenine DNA glycosylase AlkD